MTSLVTRDDIFALLAVARLGAFAMTSHGRIVFWNRAAERILGLPAAQVVGRRHDEVIAAVPSDVTAAASASDIPVPSDDRADSLPRPLTVSMLCGTGGYVEVALTPVVVADHRDGDSVTVYVFEDNGLTQPVGLGAETASTHAPAPRLETLPAPQRHQSADRVSHDLSTREIEILRLVAAGTPTEQIAHDLRISVHTVRNHIRNVRSKLGVKTKLDAVLAAIRLGLL